MKTIKKFNLSIPVCLCGDEEAIDAFVKQTMVQLETEVAKAIYNVLQYRTMLVNVAYINTLSVSEEVINPAYKIPCLTCPTHLIEGECRSEEMLTHEEFCGAAPVDRDNDDGDDNRYASDPK